MEGCVTLSGNSRTVVTSNCGGLRFLPKLDQFLPKLDQFLSSQLTSCLRDTELVHTDVADSEQMMVAGSLTIILIEVLAVLSEDVQL